MKTYNTCDCYNVPLQKIEHLTTKTTLMTHNEKSLFLQLMKEHRPKKVLEIGSHKGGTTAAIMSAIIELELDAHLHSIELNDYFADYTKKTVADVIGSVYPNWDDSKFTVHSGGVVAQFIEEIGVDVDFCIIDALHVTPGEIFDFLTVLPFLSENAIVVLHDIRVAQRGPTMFWTATNMLLSSVVAQEKYTIASPKGNLFNIGAFQVNSDTRKYIDGVVNLLSIPWSVTYYCEDYYNFFIKHYPEHLHAFYNECFRSGKCTGENKPVYYDIDKLASLMENNKVIFRGAGLNFINFWNNIHSTYSSMNKLSSTAFSDQKDLIKKMKSVYSSIVAVDANSSCSTPPTFEKLYDLNYLKSADKQSIIIITPSNEFIVKEIKQELRDFGFSAENILHLDDFILKKRATLNYLF